VAFDIPGALRNIPQGALPANPLLQTPQDQPAKSRHRARGLSLRFGFFDGGPSFNFGHSRNH